MTQITQILLFINLRHLRHPRLKNESEYASLSFYLFPKITS